MINDNNDSNDNHNKIVIQDIQEGFYVIYRMTDYVWSNTCNN